MLPLKIPTINRPIRHLRRYRHILTVFSRHGFGFALSQLPAEPLWLRDLSPFPTQEPASLPVHFRQALEELGPAFVKLGQMLSTRPDLLPPAYIVELSRLQDKVQPVPWKAIEPVLTEAFGKPVDEIFDELDMTPLASASIAQVYEAKLKTRQHVVIKVQRPNIHPVIKTDLEIIRDIAKYADAHTSMGELYNLTEIAEDFADTLNAELDFITEGRNADRFRANFAKEEGVYIPYVYWDYTSKNVMVLEYIEGIKLDDLEAIEAAGYDRERIANHAARMIIKEVLEDGYFHADPHPGNFVVMENEVIGAMDFGIVGFLSHADRNNLIMLYSMAVGSDAEGLTDGLIHIDAAPPDVNRKALTTDIARLLNKYSGLTLKQVRLDELFQDLMPLAFEYHLHFPSNLWLLAKTLSMMEGIGLKLAPDFDIFAFSARYVTKLVIESRMPSVRWLNAINRRAVAWGDLFDEIPHFGRLMLDRIINEEPVKLSLDKHSLQVIDRLVTRLALSLIVVGMIIGLAQLIPVVAQSGWIVQAIVIISFIGALAMGAAVFISIIRRNN